MPATRNGIGRRLRINDPLIISLCPAISGPRFEIALSPLDIAPDCAFEQIAKAEA
jgi:hypothetical protein